MSLHKYESGVPARSITSILGHFAPPMPPQACAAGAAAAATAAATATLVAPLAHLSTVTAGLPPPPLPLRHDLYLNHHQHVPQMNSLHALHALHALPAYTHLNDFPAPSVWTPPVLSSPAYSTAASSIASSCAASPDHSPSFSCQPSSAVASAAARAPIAPPQPLHLQVQIPPTHWLPVYAVHQMANGLYYYVQCGSIPAPSSSSSSAPANACAATSASPSPTLFAQQASTTVSSFATTTTFVAAPTCTSTSPLSAFSYTTEPLRASCVPRVREEDITLTCPTAAVAAESFPVHHCHVDDATPEVPSAHREFASQSQLNVSSTSPMSSSSSSSSSVSSPLNVSRSFSLHDAHASPEAPTMAMTLDRDAATPAQEHACVSLPVYSERVHRRVDTLLRIAALPTPPSSSSSSSSSSSPISSLSRLSSLSHSASFSSPSPARSPALFTRALLMPEQAAQAAAAQAAASSPTSFRLPCMDDDSMEVVMQRVAQMAHGGASPSCASPSPSSSSPLPPFPMSPPAAAVQLSFVGGGSSQ